MTTEFDEIVQVGVVCTHGSRKVTSALRTVGGLQVVGWRHYQTLELYEEPKEAPPTVKGNSRQKLVEGKRHTWPAVKTRKGHR